MIRTWLAGFLVVMTGCSAVTTSGSDDRSSFNGGPSSESGSSSGSSGDPSGSSSGDPSGGSSAPSAGTGKAEAGVLTAGVWDDNRNFDLFMGYRAKIKSSNAAGFLPTTDAEHQTANQQIALTPRETLDVSLVIDTTGSMGDEIKYLQKELDALMTTIGAKYPNAQQRWSLVLYRDVGDTYVVKPFEFSATASDIKSNLMTAAAGGGGDTPEAPDQALAAANKLAWRSSASTAKLMFWVADAPHHDTNATAMADAIRGARDKGIHVYPIASSGIDERTELGMRSAAQLTGGRYVFLTNDSGVGGAHKEPSVPCYFVTKLDKAILRNVEIELSGVYREPEAADILRTGGDPKSGLCTLASGGTATIY